MGGRQQAQARKKNVYSSQIVIVVPRTRPDGTWRTRPRPSATPPGYPREGVRPGPVGGRGRGRSRGPVPGRQRSANPVGRKANAPSQAAKPAVPVAAAAAVNPAAEQTTLPSSAAPATRSAARKEALPKKAAAAAAPAAPEVKAAGAWGKGPPTSYKMMEDARKRVEAEKVAAAERVKREAELKVKREEERQRKRAEAKKAKSEKRRAAKMAKKAAEKVEAPTAAPAPVAAPPAAAAPAAAGKVAWGGQGIKVKAPETTAVPAPVETATAAKVPGTPPRSPAKESVSSRSPGNPPGSPTYVKLPANFDTGAQGFAFGNFGLDADKASKAAKLRPLPRSLSTLAHGDPRMPLCLHLTCRQTPTPFQRLILKARCSPRRTRLLRVLRRQLRLPQRPPPPLRRPRSPLPRRRQRPRRRATCKLPRRSPLRTRSSTTSPSRITTIATIISSSTTTTGGTKTTTSTASATRGGAATTTATGTRGRLCLLASVASEALPTTCTLDTRRSRCRSTPRRRLRRTACTASRRAQPRRRNLPLLATRRPPRRLPACRRRTLLAIPSLRRTRLTA